MEHPTTYALRVALSIMRDPARDPDLRLSAAHVAIVLEHATDEELRVIDERVLGTNLEAGHVAAR